ncbi:MAG: hypothetical protein ACR2KT_03505 [Methylocella sp.]|nr:MAG: hypothetical protein DLM68_14990 [Hyphomicrobiales bacterium]
MADETTLRDNPPAEKPKYNQAFFLDLAAKGKDAWNKWRRDPANKYVRVTFAGVDFSETPRDEIDFSGFEFGHGADFSGCSWRGAELKFQEDPEAFKPGRACFTHAVFGDWASFLGAAFGDQASFLGVAFGVLAHFTSAAFGYRTTFTNAAFGLVARFDGAAFGHMASFDGTVFKGQVAFVGTSKERWSRPVISKLVIGMDEKALLGLEKRHDDSWKRDDSRPDRFLTISFANARFDGEADFSGRSFEQTADFIGAHFYHPPDFDGVTHASRIDFTGAYIGFVSPGKRLHWTKNSRIPVRLRAFRKIAEETKNHDLERDLYIEERKAERGVYLHQLLGLDELKKNLEDINEQKKHVWLERRLQRRARNAHWLGLLAKPAKIARLIAHILWIAVMGVYWGLADYGRSFVRPFVCWLVLSLIIFPWLYGQILPAPQNVGALDADKYEQAVQMVARANAVPFVGPLTIDAEIKKFLFCEGDTSDKCHPIPPKCYQWLVLGQNLLSIILVFFIGLALRNYFKIK